MVLASEEGFASSGNKKAECFLWVLVSALPYRLQQYFGHHHHHHLSPLVIRKGGPHDIHNWGSTDRTQSTVPLQLAGTLETGAHMPTPASIPVRFLERLDSEKSHPTICISYVNYL